MKKIVTLLVLFAMSVATFAQSGREIYNKYSDLPGVEAVYISQSMFRLIGRVPDIVDEAYPRLMRTIWG
jgi:hypothetical protein